MIVDFLDGLVRLSAVLFLLAVMPIIAAAWTSIITDIRANLRKGEDAK